TAVGLPSVDGSPRPQLSLQQSHPDHVHGLAFTKRFLAQDALATEPDSDVGLLGARIENGHIEADLAQVELVEGIAAQRTHGVLTQSLAPTVDLADEDAQSRRAVVAVDRLQAAVADVPVIFGETDPQRQLRGVLPPGRALDPIRLLGQGNRVALRQPRGETLVVDPAVTAGQVFPLDCSEVDPIATDHAQPLPLQHYPIRTTFSSRGGRNFPERAA